MAARVLSLFLKPAQGRPMREVSRVTAIAGKGLEGDASFGRPGREVLIVDQSTLSEFGLQPGQTRENIVLDGLDFSGVAVGTRLRVGEVVLEVTGDGTVCGFMDTIRPGLREAIRGRRGLLACVLKGGQISVADTVHVNGPTASD